MNHRFNRLMSGIFLITMATTTMGQTPSFQYPEHFIKKPIPKQLPTPQEKPTIPVIYKAQHQNATDLKQQLDPLFPNLKIQANPLNQKLILYGPQKTILQATDLLNQYDTPPQQLLFQVEIIEIAHAGLDQYANLFTKLTSGLAINYDFKKNIVTLPTSLEGTLAALIQTGQAKVIAKPLIKTSENNRAFVRVGDQLPFITSISEGQIKISNFQQINTGIYVEILPKIISDSSALTEIQIEISNVKLWKEMNSIQYPIIATRKTETTVILSTETPLIIAGLFQEETNENQTEVPYLSQIPLLGKLFKSKKKESAQTDILIKVQILNPNSLSSKV